jgi:hypothetical protein
MMNELVIEEIREQKSLFDVNRDEDMETVIEDVRPPRSLFDVPISDDENGENEMQTLGLCDNPQTEKEKGFWRRQFQQETTDRQKRYDWTFGVILPIICFFFDPFVFKFWGAPGGGILGAYRPFAYAGSFLSVIGLMAWLIWREKLGGFGAFLSGIFFLAGLVSLALGIAMIPISLIGLMAIVGVLGFTPLFTSVIYLRNAVRAYRAANLNLCRSKLIYAAATGAIWAFAIPYTLNVEVNRSLDLIARGTPETIRIQGWKLRLLAPLVDPDQLKTLYWKIDRGSAQEREIEILYQQLTGKQLNVNRNWDGFQ